MEKGIYLLWKNFVQSAYCLIIVKKCANLKNNNNNHCNEFLTVPNMFEEDSFFLSIGTFEGKKKKKNSKALT